MKYKKAKKLLKYLFKMRKQEDTGEDGIGRTLDDRAEQAEKALLRYLQIRR